MKCLVDQECEAVAVVPSLNEFICRFSEDFEESDVVNKKLSTLIIMDSK